jgi:transposase
MMLAARMPNDNHKTARFADTPWNEQSDEWQRLDARLPEGHLARRVHEACKMLDFSTLRESYAAVGKEGLLPEILVRIMLYEIQSQRLSPAQWARDVRENEPLRWLARGLQPSRSTLYAFRDRVALWVDQWNASLVSAAMEQGMTPARRAAIDGSTMAANASRRQLANQERLDRRQQLLDDAIQGNLAENERPHWMASTPSGQLRQKETYNRANEILQQRMAYNDRQRSSKRKPPNKVLVSMTDPEAALGRDKLSTFRPLYNVQLLRDLDSPLILAYDTFATTNDAGLIGSLLERAMHAIGRKLKQVLADSSYASLHDLEACHAVGIELFAPWQENDYSKQNKKKKGTNQFTQIPKSEFIWDANEQQFRCPEGHALNHCGTRKVRRSEYGLTEYLYTCSPEHCLTCPRQSECTRNPHKGRTVSRLENEDLLDALRERMQLPDAKALYKLRSQTVELNFADLKQHRDLRRFRSRTLSRAKTQVGLSVLAHNMLTIQATDSLANFRSSEPQTRIEIECLTIAA